MIKTVNIVVRGERIFLNFHSKESLFRLCRRDLANLVKGPATSREFAIEDTKRVIESYRAAASLLDDRKAEFLREVAAQIEKTVAATPKGCA